MENNPNSIGDHWIATVNMIATLIIALIQPFIQVLFVRWLRNRQRRRSAANPDTNQPSDLQTNRSFFWKRILYLFGTPLACLAIAVYGLVSVLREEEPITRETIFLISSYMMAIAFSIFTTIVAFVAERISTWQIESQNEMLESQKEISSLLDQLGDTIKSFQNEVGSSTKEAGEYFDKLTQIAAEGLKSKPKKSKKDKRPD